MLGAGSPVLELLGAAQSSSDHSEVGLVVLAVPQLVRHPVQAPVPEVIEVDDAALLAGGLPRRALHDQAHVVVPVYLHSQQSRAVSGV